MDIKGLIFSVIGIMLFIAIVVASIYLAYFFIILFVFFIIGFTIYNVFSDNVEEDEAKRMANEYFKREKRY